MKKVLPLTSTAARLHPTIFWEERHEIAAKAYPAWSYGLFCGSVFCNLHGFCVLADGEYDGDSGAAIVAKR